MAEYFPCQIEIGGAVTEEQLKEIEKICAVYGGSLEWGAKKATVDEMLKSLALGDGIVITDSQAKCGEMDDLELYLEKEKIQYILNSDADADSNATCTYFNGVEAKNFTADQSGSIVVTQGTIKNIIDLIKSGKTEEAIASLALYATDPQLDKLVLVKPIFDSDQPDDASVSLKR